MVNKKACIKLIQSKIELENESDHSRLLNEILEIINLTPKDVSSIALSDLSLSQDQRDQLLILVKDEIHTFQTEKEQIPSYIPKLALAYQPLIIGLTVISLTPLTIFLMLGILGTLIPMGLPAVAFVLPLVGYMLGAVFNVFLDPYLNEYALLCEKENFLETLKKEIVQVSNMTELKLSSTPVLIHTHAKNQKNDSTPFFPHKNNSSPKHFEADETKRTSQLMVCIR